MNDQARENQQKNRGNPGEWFQHKADYRPPQPTAKLRYGGIDIANKHRATIDEVIRTNAYPRDVSGVPFQDSPVHVRLRNEAINIADKFNHQSDKWFDFQGNMNYRPNIKEKTGCTEVARNIAHTNDQRRSHEWYKHNGTQTVDSKPPTGRIRCTSVLGREIARQMQKTEVSQCMVRDERSLRRRSASASSSPRMGPRNKLEGVENAMRNRGTADEWSRHHSVMDDSSLVVTGGSVPYRCTSSEASNNWSKARGRDMARCFDYTAPPDNDQPAPRVQREGLEYRERNQKGYIGLAAEGRALVRSHSAAPAVRMRPEGGRIAEKLESHMSELFDQQKNLRYESPRPQARIRTTEAENAANKSKGQMATVIGSSTDYRPSAPPRKNPVRAVPGPAADNFSRNNGSSMKQLVENYRLPPDPAPKARITSWGEDIAQRDTGSSELNQLFTQYGKLPRDNQPQMRIRREVQHIATKHTQDHLFDVMTHN